MTQYRWKFDGLYKQDPQVVGTHIERIASQKGDLVSAGDVLGDASNPNSPLHPLFQWDDSVAAQEYRLNQASDLLRNIVCVVAVSADGDEDQTFRAFINVGEGGTRGYATLARIQNDKELRFQAINRAYRELQSWKRRYSDHQELLGVIKAIDSLPSLNLLFEDTVV